MNFNEAYANFSTHENSLKASDENIEALKYSGQVLQLIFMSITVIVLYYFLNVF
jgi:hypothetical protein